ncbi:MAG: zf-TFIIB domain-containing protein [Planctomycetota bacterium]|nr:zf-TFIIB domain-containing protein [Planctomycetota bacterium]
MKCPRCPDNSLDPHGQGSWNCKNCEGVFLENAPLQDGLFEPAESSDIIACPGCAASMAALRLDDTVIDRCPACAGVWLDAGETLGSASIAGKRSLSRLLVYSLTVPERAVRSTVGLAAGAVRETAEFIVPQAFKSAKTYELVVRNSLSFLTDKVGGVKPEGGANPDVNDDFVARKAVGNFIDLAGLATLHCSPVWIMAILSDVAYGTKSYVHELASELRKQGLIDAGSTIDNVDDVLNAVQSASGHSASLFDTPPLSIAQLRESLHKTKEAATSADLRGMLPEHEIKAYWQEMRDISKREDVSLLGVSGALTMHTLGKVKTVTRGTLTGVQVVGGLFNRNVIGYYGGALKDIRERGLFHSLKDTSAPYVTAVWSNFANEKPTVTEEIVTGRLFGRAARKVAGWFRRKEKESPQDNQVDRSDPGHPIES